VVTLPFVDYWSNLFFLNDTFSKAIHAKADQCGYTAYLEKYFQFPPPPGPFPVLPDPYNSPNYTCDIFDDLYSALLEVNPCFNIYHVTETCPHLWSVGGGVNPGDYIPPTEVVYFNRSDVQKAINAPRTNWQQCTSTDVFGGPTDNQSMRDTSLGPAQNGVLAHVIESINNTFIGVGNLDFLLPPNGSLAALQNVTWNGQQGFQKYPNTEFYVPYHPEYNGGALSGAGIVGQWGTERGLTFYVVQLAGHGTYPLHPCILHYPSTSILKKTLLTPSLPPELPGYAPGAAYRVVETMLGRNPDLGTVSDFTTQTGNFTGTSPIYKRNEPFSGMPLNGMRSRGGWS